MEIAQQIIINTITLLLGVFLGAFGLLYLQYKIWHEQGLITESFWELLVRAFKNAFRD